MKAVHFGAGNIGRGFIGSILYKNGFEIVFVDVEDNIINQINKDKSYQIELIDDEQTKELVKNVSGINSIKNPEEVINQIIDADIITTSVGVNNLPKIAPILAKGLTLRAKEKSVVDIIANENAIKATSMLRACIAELVSLEEMAIIDEYIGFANSAIDRQSLTTEFEGKSIPRVEPYFEWVINRTEIKNKTLPELDLVDFVDDLTPYIERKLFLVNASHATTAYIGKLIGEQTIQKTLSNPKVESFVRKLLIENSEYLISEYGMDKEDLDRYINHTIERQSNPLVKDEVKRVGRGLIRKIGPNERLVGPIVKLFNKGFPSVYGECALAIALHYYDESDQDSLEIATYIKECGIQDTIKKYTKLDDEILINRIVTNYKQISLDSKSILGG